MSSLCFIFDIKIASFITQKKIHVYTPYWKETNHFYNNKVKITQVHRNMSAKITLKLEEYRPGRENEAL